MSLRRFDLRDLIAIGAGGVAGAGLRWLISNSAASRSATGADWFTYAPNTSVSFASGETRFAWETLTANTLGCLILGVVTTQLVRSSGPRRPWLALSTGFCGALTTFSTFAVDAASALRGRLGPVVAAPVAEQLAPHRTTAVLYVTLSVLCGGGAFWFGRAATRRSGPA